MFFNQHLAKNDNNMKPRLFNREPARTKYVELDTKKCQACWKCQGKCSNHVIGRVNLPWHKHAVIVNGGSCTGCLKCVRVCDSSAFAKILTRTDQTESS